MLPTVTKETFSMANSRRMDNEFSAKVFADFTSQAMFEMLTENPLLLTYVEGWANFASKHLQPELKQDAKECYMTGIFMMYKLLSNQLEVQELENGQQLLDSH